VSATQRGGLNMNKLSFKLILLMIIVISTLSGCGVSKEKQDAIDAFDAQVERIEEQVSDRDVLVTAAEELIASGKTALDDNLVLALQTAITDAKSINPELPKIPGDIEKIKESTIELKQVDLTSLTTALEVAKANLEESYAKFELVNNPDEVYVIGKLETISSIIEIMAATEDNDPNGQLNKAGGYTAAIFFSSELIDQSKISGSTVLDKGTVSGGSIEVYRTVADAEKRNNYLANFDGTIFASGSHTVIGTVVVRTSSKLKASQQQDLESNIIAALTTISN
jgi:hypothetical protein